MRYLIYTLSLLMATSLHSLAQDHLNLNLSEGKTDIETVQDILNIQAGEWNAGNVEGFMHYYWNSDSIVFISPKGKTYGWSKVLANYKKSYPDKATMGQLSFSDIVYTQLNATEIFVFGKWKVVNQSGDHKGNFHLLFKKMEGSWRIIMDYSN